MANLYQLVEGIPLATFDHTPKAPPGTPYAVVSELSEGISHQLHDHQGKPAAIKELTLLVTLWGGEGQQLADLRPTWAAVKQLQRLITSHPGIPYPYGARLGAALPPMYDQPVNRPMAAVRFILNYRE